MDIYWGNRNKRKMSFLEDGEKEDKSTETDEKTNESKKKDFMPPLEHTKLHMSNIGIDGNHIYFYSEVSRTRMLELNRALEKVNLDLMKKNIEYGVSPPIYLHIHSYGGSVLSCFSTIDTILGLDTRTISVIEGAAASAATMISIVCDERRMTPHSYMLIHQLSSGFWGKMNEIEDEYQNLQQFMSSIRELYRKYTNIPMDELDTMLKHDLWFDSNKCLEYNLVDSIGGARENKKMRTRMGGRRKVNNEGSSVV